MNRWIFPLEKKLDFLTLINGKKIEVPFELVLIFKKHVIEFAGKFVILKARGEEHVISRKSVQAA